LVAWFHRCHRLPFQDSTTLAPFLAEAKNMQVVLLPQLSPRIGTPGPVIACQDLPFQISALVGPRLVLLLSGPGRTSPSTRAIPVTGGTRAGRKWLTSHIIDEAHG
jgi:hypothetical protein